MNTTYLVLDKEDHVLSKEDVRTLSELGFTYNDTINVLSEDSNVETQLLQNILIELLSNIPEITVKLAIRERKCRTDIDLDKVTEEDLIYQLVTYGILKSRIRVEHLKTVTAYMVIME